MTVSTSEEQYRSVVTMIVEQQSKVIGRDLAYELANSVDGLKYNPISGVVFSKKPTDVLEELVNKYSVLFGKISIEVSKNAISKLAIKNQDLPPSLRF